MKHYFGYTIQRMIMDKIKSVEDEIKLFLVNILFPDL